MSKQPIRVIVSNDDGIEAPGIQVLTEILSEWADCLVVAPDGPRSGVGHALSDAGELRTQQMAAGRIAVSGTPADCARLALSPSTSLAPEWKHSLVDRSCWLVAGINHGANLGVDTYVSGTAAAAREAAILGFPAIAISHYVGRHRTIDWAEARRHARPVLRALLERPPAAGAFWNVNLPHPIRPMAELETVFCPPDPSPQAVAYERRGESFRYSGDYHARPRRKGLDIDTCLAGRVAISEIGLFSDDPDAPRNPILSD
ncbi:MAG: 5'/3'-nucleotidase SurE [Myxococcota bacterium]|nr:5'/3'-nucleotidase SurE [Myxococcota bacterium]